MTLKYGLSDAWRLDSFRKLSKKEFTFDNGRPGASSAMSRIDKFLVSQFVEEKGRRIEAAASVRKLSDHSPLVISVWGKQQEAPGNRTRFFDISFLSEENGRKELWEAWVENHPPPHHPLSRLRLASLARISHRPGNVVQRVPFKGEKATHGACVRASTKKIELVEVQLQRDLTNVEVRGILSDAQGKLADFFQNSMERNQHLFTSKWLRYRDTCSKAFFDFHRIGKKRTFL